VTAERTRAWLAGIGGRRFLLTLGAGIVSTLLVWYGKIGEQSWVTVVIATVAAYIGGNVAGKRKETNQ
jgi:hypothetical protein